MNFVIHQLKYLHQAMEDDRLIDSDGMVVGGGGGGGGGSICDIQSKEALQLLLE